MVNPEGNSSKDIFLLCLNVTEIFFLRVIFIPNNGEKFILIREERSKSL